MILYQNILTILVLSFSIMPQTSQVKKGYCIDLHMKPFISEPWEVKCWIDRFVSRVLKVLPSLEKDKVDTKFPINAFISIVQVRRNLTKHSGVG